MQRYQSYKFEVMPNGAQARQMRRIAGCCRYVFNQALAAQMECRDRGAPQLDFAELTVRLAEARQRRETKWLAQVPFGCLQQALRNLERAQAGYRTSQTRAPVFKKRGRSESFRYSGGCDIRVDQTNSRLQVPQLGWLRYRKSRVVLGRVINVALSASAGKWFGSILTVREVEQQVRSGTTVGIDMGVVRFATLSDGNFYSPLNSFRRHEKALAIAQHRQSRKIKYSNNWRKETLRVQRIHVRIGNARRDYLHKISTAISQNHAVVCIEDLRVTEMSQSPTAESARAVGRANSKRRLNKAILDQGWYEFRRQLEYKLKWNGGRLIVVSPHGTSTTCLRCRHRSKENRPSQSLFRCVRCGYEENADLVGAVNVLRAGHARLACAETSPMCGALGQEPADALRHDF
jgi:putative transposase